mgnify:CR=1 FL=1
MWATATFVPRREKAWAISEPMAPPPMMVRDSGIFSISNMFMFVRMSGTSFNPGMGGTKGSVPVAMKIFTPEPFKTQAAYDTAMGRMARVAARVAQIQQDNLLDVHNFVERNRIRIMEMEWVDGFDLSRLLSHDMLAVLKKKLDTPRWNYVNNVIVTAGPTQARLKPGIAIAVLRECLAALNALHRAKIVHGDMKPSNIMLDPYNHIRLIDFGLAKLMVEQPRMDDAEAPTRTLPTGPGMLMGTVGYLSPEQIRGQGADSRSDIFAVGCVLWEMCVGEAPFQGASDVEVMHAILKDEPRAEEFDPPPPGRGGILDERRIENVRIARSHAGGPVGDKKSRRCGDKDRGRI